ncbi:MAG: hypothetical protein GXO09_02550 [Crenarchaeota archaeon]|nr:hypothetical protein [Thermoproteota archaeon]
MERRVAALIALGLLAVLLVVPVYTAAARHGRGGGHPPSASPVSLNGVVLDVVDYKTFRLSVDNKTYVVVLPEYMTAPNGTKVPASTITQQLTSGAVVAVEGYAHDRPCYGDVLVKAYSITVNGATYTWSMPQA